MARGSSRKRTNNNNRSNSSSSSNHSQADAITNSINPTILQCLQEFEQEAQQRNQDKYLFTIRKAIRSVQKYPLPLLNGQQCRMLEGIGPVLAQKIDFWLKKKGLWQEEPQEKEQQEEEEAYNGDGADDYHHGGSSQATNASSQQQSQRAEESQSSQQQHTMSQQQASASRASSRQQSSTALVPPPKKAKSNRKYIPKFKSAPWAMLIALYRHYKKDKKSKQKSPAGLTKSELIAQCSHMSDTPMVAASSGKRKTYSYCGWNSMKSTLMEKKLVSKGRGRSHRFALTPDGLKLARKLHIGALELFDKRRDDDDEWSDATDVEDSESSEEENESEEETESRQLSPQKRVSRCVARSPLPSLSTANTASSSTDILEINSDDSEDDQDMMDTNLLSHIASQPRDTNQRASSIVRQSSSSQVISPKSPTTNRDKVSPQEKLRMSYLNASHKPVPFKDQAQVHISSELGLVFLCQIVVPSHNTIDESKLEENLISLNNKTSSAFIDIDLMKRFREQDQKEGYEILLWLSDDACGESSADLAERFFTNKQSLKLFTSSHSITTQNSQSAHTLPSSQPIQTTSTAPVFLSQKTTSTETNKKRKRKHDESINLELTQMEDVFDFQTYTQPSQQPSHGEPSSQRRRLSNFSENYQLILVVDQRERHNNDRSYIVQQLEKTGINVESSQLGVGDFLWIARSKDQKEEHVLNFIIERKAVDDLAASIVDGRYKEQRFRLRQISEDQQAGHDLTPASASCLNVIYLIEGEYSRQKRLPVKNIQNALVRLQVSDQFQVKQTLSIAQSIEYLANMTKVMEKLLQDKGLDYCRLVLEDDGEIFEPNLRQFNCYATKSGSDQRNLSPSHLFARQLCCIHGCSPQIAKAIIERFASNARDFIEKVSSKEGIEQLSNVKIPCGRFQGVSVRKIGPALSKSLASYYTSS